MPIIDSMTIPLVGLQTADASGTTQQTGYPVGNFGIAGEITPTGRLLSRVMYNPPVLGPWLEELGNGRFSFTCDGVEVFDDEFESKRVYRIFPEASAAFADSRFRGLSINVEFLAPIKVREAFSCTIPALCADMEFVNETEQERSVSVAFAFRSDAVSDGTAMTAGGFTLAGSDRVRAGFDGVVSWQVVDDGLVVSGSTTVPAQGKSKLRFLLICHDSNGYYAAKCPDMPSLVSYVAENWDRFKADRAEFINLLPRTHDDQINRYLRWYIQAAVVLTRMTRDTVHTMGYCELNQRDSYWTSWPHLVLWPDLECRMIKESAEHQREDGKIPTTILPLIEREDDIDINEYFNMRIARYYQWTHDLEFVRTVWPSFKRSVDYLVSTDKDGDGLLDQGSFWGDWKDVIGVEGRKAAPHFELLWLAVLKAGMELAAALDDSDAQRHYTELYDRSYEVINKPVKDGGMWTGDFYTTLWYDSREDRHVQEDQLVGPLFGVVPEHRIPKIYQALEPNMTDWGVRDTYPYREPFNNVGGDYHNGGVWVFLNFADALSRFVTGYPETGCQILKRVGEWDLEKWGDYMPAEYLDGNTGQNAGKPIQGWDADFYAAVLFGIYGVKMLSATSVEIMPRISDTESFETPITLPQGVIHLKQVGGEDSLSIEIRSELDYVISVCYGVMTSRSFDGAETVRVGECEFRVVEFDLEPNTTYKLSLN